MATKVFMEALSPTMEEGRLVKWNKNEGDAVKSGDSLAEIETDKAIMELVARGDGVLRKRLVNEGDSRPVGTVLAVIAGADEDIASIVAAAGSAPASGSAAPAPASPPPAPTQATEKPAAAGAAAASPPQPATVAAAPASTPAPQQAATPAG